MRTGAAQDLAQGILGFWALESWRRVYPDGVSVSYSEQALDGFLHYSSDGQMAVAIFERGAPRLISSYGGPYEVQGSEVWHQPLVGYSPYGVSSAKKRHLTLEQGRLKMETDWIEEDGRTSKFCLCWTKKP